MLAVPYSEVLSRDWLPPVVLGHEGDVAEVVRRLDPPNPCAPGPWIAGVGGPRGSGTSTVARRAAREVGDRLRAARPGPAPRTLMVRVAGCRGTHGVATALLRGLDDGFEGRGFPVVEIVAGCLRRLRRDGRPVVLVLDDLYPGGPSIAPIVRALGNPDRFLPEGESGLPPLWLVVAGTVDALERCDEELRGRPSVGPSVRIGAYPARTLRSIIGDRLGRALGRPPPPEHVHRLVASTVASGGGAVRAIDLVRRALLGPELGVDGRPRAASRRSAGIPVESSVLRAIEEATRGVEAVVGEVRRLEARYARQSGADPLPPTTLWRRIVRLEQAGYVRREVRPGGVGGTRSLVRLMTPVDEWVVSPASRGTRPGSGPWLDAPAGPEPGERWEASRAPWPPDDGAG